MHKVISLVLIVLLTGLLTTSLFAKPDEFPGRVKYPALPYIELDDLRNKLNDVVVVDARSILEFETLRIKNAINIPIASKTFEDQVLKLRKDTAKPIIFYCNGRKCMKSFIAVKKAKEAGIKDVYAYDAGILNGQWPILT